MIKIMVFCFIIGQIKEINPPNGLKIKIQTYQEDTYYLLTKDRPLEVKVEGPTWLRVYTRIPWPEDDKGSKAYKLILQENDMAEKFITLETEYSKVAKLDKIRLSKWRSFYINVPKGINTYHFIAWRAPSDTILMKFSFETPKRWVDIIPNEYNAKLELVEDERIINYFELTNTKPVILVIEGPITLKVISRLNYSMTMDGEQFYSIEVKEKDKIVKKNSFRAYRSETTTYHNRKELMPSNPRTFYLKIQKGRHSLQFNIAGTNIESAGLRLMVEEK